MDILCSSLTMRRSPRRPLILKRRKLPFQQNDPPPRSPKEAAKSPPSRPLPDGIRILDHPSLPNTQVVVIPKTADLQSVIEALTVKGKERGAQGCNKFILLGESGSLDSGSLTQAKTEDVFTGIPAGQQQSGASSFTGIKQYKKEEDCVPFDDSLTCMQWLERSGAFQAVHDALDASKENQTTLQSLNAHSAPQVPECEKPPFSYMTMIQFAINSRKDRRMTLKEIYKWLQDHFPFFRDEAKNGWKNSVRHNLSLHNMFLRKPSPYRNISFWTIRPEANRGLTLDQVYKPGCDPVPAPYAPPMLPFSHQQQMPTVGGARKSQTILERRMKPLLPRTPSCLAPMQLPVSTSSMAAHTPLRHSLPEAKRPRKGPKVAPSNQHNTPLSSVSRVEVKAKPLDLPAKRKSPRALAKRQTKVSRRKQRLVHSLHDEPVLVYSEHSDFDSGVATSPTFLDSQEEHRSPDRLFSNKTPIKTSSSRLTSSTPSKPHSGVLAEPWTVTPLGKQGRSVLDFSPIRTPSGPAVTPLHDYTTFSLSGTPFKDWPLLCSPATSPSASATPFNRSLTEGLILDTTNDSLSKILVDFSFALEDDELALANISLSEIIPQLK
ncbi:forkhead box protein M1 isoform X2 [Dunckerocampus dactyliophorus]|uniref:forkhead box protein M1 isoform X2 n=1 Tax=Dunckerocampus dactyliophorus TaxID=161453 RepID=UPI002405959A|nr:forkhead box protein M1 isoform X2 [Dunckerocampus dactyliophorus]